ncbi:hypothetical protein ESCOCP360M_22500 [Escherichia coli]
MSISRICWDTGGIDPTIVYERSKKHGLFRVIPIKGASVYGKPVASMPRNGGVRLLQFTGLVIALFFVGDCIITVMINSP